MLSSYIFVFNLISLKIKKFCRLRLFIGKSKLFVKYYIKILLKECIRVLKQLQSNEEVLKAEDDSPPDVRGPVRVQEMRKWVSRAGITVMFTYHCSIIHIIV
jgi:hypothetical protein